MYNVLQKLNQYFQGFELGLLDPKAQTVSVMSGKKNQIPFMKFRNAQGDHVFVRPILDREPYYFLCDDLFWDSVQKFHMSGRTFRPGRMVVESSPGNFQVWVHSREPVSNESKYYWTVKRMGGDPACYPQRRWGRCPGFRNRKEKYRNEKGFPISKLVWVDHAACVSIFNFQPSLCAGQSIQEFQAPRTVCAPCSITKIRRSDFEVGDPSRTDFRFSLALIRAGASDEQIKQCILNQREEFQHHKGESRLSHYLKRTIQRARMVINERNANG